MGARSWLLLTGLFLGAYLMRDRIRLLVDPPKPVRATPYVTVYGRDSCGWTGALREELRLRGVPFQFQIIDDSAVGAELYPRMQRQGLSVEFFNLPVVDVNGGLVIRPAWQEVVDRYSR